MKKPTGPNRIKICGRCGVELVCGPVDGASKCWCEELPPIMPFTGGDCMCPKCALAEVARLEKKRALPEKEPPRG
ncbi:MAG: cysteine-rich CWC family protein [Elusimicrobiota bacterium]